MSIHLLRAGLPGLAIALMPIGEGFAHEVVGNRFFPATLTIDDPGVNDELSFPTVVQFQDRRRSFIQAARLLRRVLQTDHRGVRDLDRLNLHAISARPAG